jgi:hypothetical protein
MPRNNHRRGEPPKDKVAFLTRALDIARAEAGHLKGVLAEIIVQAAGPPEDKEFGCERCSDCTLRIADILERQASKLSAFSDQFVLTIPKFLPFPRAMAHLVLRYTEDAAKADEATRKRLANVLTDLCDKALKAYQSGDFLGFARLATLLLLLVQPVLLSHLALHGVWRQLEAKFKTIGDTAGGLKDYLQDRLPPDALNDINTRTEKRDRPKRVCGGGLIAPPPNSNEPKTESIFVLDYSQSHVFGIAGSLANRPLSQWVFSPCKRELPFTVDAYPITRGDEKVVEIKDPHFKKFAGYYVLFEIKKIDPDYYYTALCARSTSNQALSAGRRLSDTFDWPHLPNMDAFGQFEPVDRPVRGTTGIKSE